MDMTVEELKRGIVAALKTEQWAEALPLLETWCERFPEHAKTWLNRGFCLFRLDRLSEAVEAFDRCLELDPSMESAQGWRRKALAGLDAAHTMANEEPGAPTRTRGAQTAAAQPALSGMTRRAGAESHAPPSFATMAIPSTGSGWQAGQVVDGRYEVHEMARGGMAVVAIAFDRELWRMVAIKTPLPSMLATSDGRMRFQREAESWIALGVHPNICCAYYLQQIGAMPRLFIEYVDGGDLNDWLKRDEQPSMQQRLDLAIQIAGGLDYTNTFDWTDDDGVEHKGLVHRDIKPANVLVTSDGIARVTDFGLVRSHSLPPVDGGPDVRDQVDAEIPMTANAQDTVATGSWKTVTAEGGLVGTPPYMAPELWKQAHRGTVATDVYAYGCMLYEIFCGRRPFVMKSDSQTKTREAHLGSLMRMHLRDQPPHPLSLDSGLDARLGELMIGCLSKEAGERPASFAAVRNRLLTIYEDVVGEPYPRPEPKRTQLLADSLNNRGASFVTLGLVDRAQWSFREALEVDPRHLEAGFNSSLLEWRREGLTDAELERRLAEAGSVSGNAGRAGLLRAQLRLLLDDPSGTLDTLDTLPEEVGESLGARRTAGIAQLACARSSSRHIDIGQTCELLRGVVEESPSDLKSMIGLAEACRLAGDLATAEEALSAARGLDRELPEDLTDAVAAHLAGHRLLRDLGHQAPVQCLATLGDGRVAARTGDSDVFVWGRSGDRPEIRFDLGGPARQGRSIVTVGSSLVACLENGPLTVYEIASGRRLRSFRTHPGVATCLATSPDRINIASGGSDRALRIWNVESGECERTFQGHEAFISAVAWHPKEPWVLTASADGTARLWNLFQGRCVHVFTGHNGPIRSLAVDQTGRFAASAGQDGTVGIWSPVTGEHLRFVRGHTGAVTAVCITGDVLAAGGDDGTVRLWDLESGEAHSVVRLSNPVQDLAVSVERPGLVAASGSHAVFVALPEKSASRLPLVLSESAASGELAGREQQFRTLLTQAREHIESHDMEAAISPLRAARAVPGYELHEDALELWNRALAFFPKRASRSVVELRRLGGTHGALAACALLPGGEACLVGGGDGTVRRLGCQTGEEEFSVKAHGQGVMAMAVSGDGELAASVGRDGKVQVRRTADGIRRFSFGGKGGAERAVVFGPGDHSVISGGDDKVVRIWRLEETARAEVIGGCDDAVAALAVSADGRFLIGGGWDSMVTVWSLRRRQELRRMAGHEGVVHAVAVSPDCRLVASGGEDGTVRLWDLEGGRMWRTLSGHEEAVHAVAFTPDGRYLFSAGKDTTIRLWDVRTGSKVRVIGGHAGAVLDLAVDRDGGLAASVGADASARLWFLDWEPELPDRGRWDDRARPFLKVFLRQREEESPGGVRPTWTDRHLELLTEDLGRRGFGWLDPERVEKELEELARVRGESRAEEQKKTREQAKRRARQIKMAPLREIVGRLGDNIGPKVAAVAAGVIAVLLVLWSVTGPSGPVGYSKHFNEIGVGVQGRGLRIERGTVSAYQIAHSLGSQDCAQESFVDLVRVVIEPETLRSPPPDPGVPADDAFRNRYATAVNCVGTLGSADLADQILRGAARGLHAKRVEDLTGVLVRIGAADSRQMEQALAHQAESVRHLAAATMVYGRDDHGGPELLAALRSDDRQKVEAASSVFTELLCLGVVKEDEAFELVRTYCQNIDPLVRRNAVRALALFDNKEPVREVVEGALADSDPRVVQAAREARRILDSS